MTSDQVEKLISYCMPGQMALKAILKDELQSRDREVLSQDGFLYSIGTHPILLIAHLDTVHESYMGMPFDIVVDNVNPDNPMGDLRSENGIGGDDRAGIFIVMEIIKQIDCHVLFCEDEEQGGIGADKFCETDIRPDVHFIVEFDRRNRNDAVFYDCYSPLQKICNISIDVY